MVWVTSTLLLRHLILRAVKVSTCPRMDAHGHDGRRQAYVHSAVGYGLRACTLQTMIVASDSKQQQEGEHMAKKVKKE